MSDTAAPTRLTEFLRTRQHDILVRWEAAVRALPSARPLDQLTLVDHIPALLDRIAEIAAHEASEVHEVAQEHSLHRLEEGFDLTEAVVELGALRDCVLGLWHEELVASPHVAELRILNRAIDQAVVEAIKRFTAARERTLAAIDRIVTAALESENVEDLFARLLTIVVETTPALDTAAILLREGDQLRLCAAVGFDTAVPIGTTIPYTDGFAGAVATSARPMSVRVVGDDPLFALPAFRELGLKTLYGVPLLDGDRVIGVAHMGSRSAPDFSTQDKRLFAALAARATTAIIQHLLAERFDERDRQLATRREFVNEATAILSSVLDYEQTLQHLAELVVPGLADWCAVDLVTDSGLTRLAITDTEPATLERAEAQGVDRVVQSGEPQAGPSAIIVPLSARGRTIGAITLRANTARRSYTSNDVELAVELGQRAGIAVDNSRLYAAAQHAVRAREDVLAIVSHDLRTPLGAIDLSASLLMPRTLGDARMKKQIEIIRRSATRMDHLIGDLLDMASIQAGRLSLTRASEDAGTLVNDVVDTHALAATEKGIDLVTDSHVEGVELVCDRERLLQVFGNLISNAIKFCRPDDAITLTATADATHARFEVRDTGPGIPASELPRIFDPYWSAARHAKKGTGLGLYICKGIVEAHGGTLTVTSELGAGATFVVALPRA